MDGNGTEVYNGTFEGNGSLMHDFVDAALGNWSMSLDYTNFTGSFGFAVGETIEDGGPNGTDGSGSGSGGSGGSGSGGSGDSGSGSEGGSEGSEGSSNETLDDSGDNKESPVTPIAFVLIGLGLVAVLRRRD